MTSKQRLFSYLKPMRKSLLIALVFSLLFVIAQIAQPFLLGRALDASKDNDHQLFNIYVFVALGLIIIGIVFAYLFEVIVMNVSQKVIKKARDDVYQKINAMPILIIKDVAILSNLKLEIWRILPLVYSPYLRL